MYYTYKNIKQFASTNKIIFILFILCEFIAVVIMFFSYGTYQNFKILKNQEIHKYDINISFGNIIDKSIDEEYIIYECDGSIDNSAAKKFLSHISKDTFEEIEGIFYTAKSEPVSNLNNEPLEICFRLQYSPKEKKLVPFDTSFNNSTSMYGKTFSYEDYNNGVKKIILPSYYSPEYIGKNIIINGESYK